MIQRPTVIVVDAIRNPFEAMYFSSKYANFYLMAVNKPEQQRIRGLKNKGLKTVEIEDIDNQECPDKDMDASNYHRVNISKCEEMADVYLVNDNDEHVDNADALGRQIMKYLALMLKPGIVNPTRVETCMQVANTVKLNSGCLSRQVGAVVTDKNYNILSVGWNTTPGNQVPCNLRSAYDLVKKSDSSAFSQYECENEDFRSRVALKLLIRRRGRLERREDAAEHGSDPFFPYCFKDVYNGIKKNKNQVHTRSIHGEEMAFLNKIGRCRDGILFTTSSPCELCAKKACHEGIGRIYYLVPYRGIAGDHILKGAEPELKMELFRGLTGGAFSKLYTPLIAQKDERYMTEGFRFTQELKEIRIKSVGPLAKGETAYLRVAEDGEGDARYAVELDTHAHGSTFMLVEEDQKLLVQYTLTREPDSGTGEGPCPLCRDEDKTFLRTRKTGEASARAAAPCEAPMDSPEPKKPPRAVVGR